MFDIDTDKFSHMPFVAQDEKGNPVEFCCIRVGIYWKLHWNNNGVWERIKTGLPEDAWECSPVAEYDEGMWKVSFIAGGQEGARRFKLYRMYGIDSEPDVISEADVGFSFKNRIVAAGRSSSIEITSEYEHKQLNLHGVSYLYRISCDPFEPNNFLISGQFEDEKIFSWLYRPGIKELYSVIADGIPAYKCALWQHDCYYAMRLGGFEDRRIVKAKDWHLDKLDAEKYITEEEL